MSGLVIKIDEGYPLTNQACRIVKQTSARPYPDTVKASDIFSNILKVACDRMELKTPKFLGSIPEITPNLSKRTALAFSGGKDCLATALLLRESGLEPTLYFVRGVNRSYHDEEQIAVRIANEI